MEKKPKEGNWHGGSQIEPAKQLDMSKPLIGADILQLDEMDVAPEDVFLKFYMNEMNYTKKPKRKRKGGTKDKAAEDLIGEGDEEDESDNEEINAILDSTNPALGTDGEYDYNDLDQIADEDDNNLVGTVSDEEMEFPIDLGEDNDMAGDDDVSIGDAEDGSDDEEDVFEVQPKKRKAHGKSGVSPFTSIEEYEHLLDDDNDDDDENANKNVKDLKKHKTKSNKKARRSKPKKKKVSTE